MQRPLKTPSYRVEMRAHLLAGSGLDPRTRPAYRTYPEKRRKAGGARIESKIEFGEIESGECKLENGMLWATMLYQERA